MLYGILRGVERTYGFQIRIDSLGGDLDATSRRLKAILERICRLNFGRFSIEEMPPSEPEPTDRTVPEADALEAIARGAGAGAVLDEPPSIHTRLAGERVTL
jgi:hypothetical protein